MTYQAMYHAGFTPRGCLRLCAANERWRSIAAAT